MQIEIQYEIILHWSKQDQAFIAEVPELPGCAADGATYQEALASVEVVIREWIETARELGRPIPEPRGRLIFAWRCATHNLMTALTVAPLWSILTSREFRAAGWVGRSR
jgi:predicted RNase H-like HicB family nuclease